MLKTKKKPKTNHSHKIYDPKTGAFDAAAAKKFFKALAKHPESWWAYMCAAIGQTEPIDQPGEFLEYLDFQANLTPSEIRQIEAMHDQLFVNAK